MRVLIFLNYLVFVQGFICPKHTMCDFKLQLGEQSANLAHCRKSKNEYLVANGKFWSKQFGHL